MSKLTNGEVSERINKTLGLGTSDDIQRSFFMLVEGPHQRHNDRQRQSVQKMSPSEWHTKPNRDVPKPEPIYLQKMSPRDWYKKTRLPTSDTEEFCL